MKSLRHYFLVLLLIITVHAVNAQPQDFKNYVQLFLDGYNEPNVAKMEQGSDLLKSNYPDERLGYYLGSFAYLCKKEYAKAHQDINRARNIDPLSFQSYVNQIFLSYLRGNMAEKEQVIYHSLQLFINSDTSFIQLDIDMLQKFTGVDFSRLPGMIDNAIRNGALNPVRANNFLVCAEGIIYGGASCNSLDAGAAGFLAVKHPNPMISDLLPMLKGLNFYLGGNSSESIRQLEAFIQKTENNPLLYWQRSYALEFISTLKHNAFDSRGAILAINHALEEYKHIGFPSELLARMQFQKMQVLSTIENGKQEKLQLAFQLEQTAKAIKNDLYLGRAYNAIGVYYTMDGPQSERGKGAEYLGKALTLAKKINDKELIRTTGTNFVIIRARQGQYAEARNLTEGLVMDYLRENDYSKAQNLYNNLAFILYTRGNYSEAANLFEKSVTLAERYKSNLNAKQKLEYTNEVSGAYLGLIMSYKHLNVVDKVFETQERSRSNYLKELMGYQTQIIKIHEARELLKPDEILLSYTIGRPGEVIITAITKDKAEIRYAYPVEDLLKLKKKYTDRIKQIPPELNPYLKDLNVDYSQGELVRYANMEAAYKKEDFITLLEWTRELLQTHDKDLIPMQKEFLRQWYELTLNPVRDLLANHHSVIISSSSELNYLPFEAFLSPNNEYFIEKHDVKYVPSASVLKGLAARHYSADRKSAIAFGGAFFQPSGNITASIRGIEDLYRVSDAVNRKISKGVFNFKQELEALGFGGANYLSGTLKEVQFVGALAKDVTVFTGKDMTESHFKQLDKTGELKKYKTLLISSHGFTDDLIPEFSGVMFTQPNGGDKNEDTFLVAPEIARLNLNADLVILSACDTGLGKLYGGEGVNGLNAAFMAAGSNATLLSLWPVDDAGTALTMQNLLKNVIQNQTDTAMTLSAIKREFVKGTFGETYKLPVFWAPFLYNGK